MLNEPAIKPPLADYHQPTTLQQWSRYKAGTWYADVTGIARGTHYYSEYETNRMFLLCTRFHRQPGIIQPGLHRDHYRNGNKRNRPTYLFKSVLVGAGDVSTIPLREDEQALMPQNRKDSGFRGEGHEVVDQRVDDLQIISRRIQALVIGCGSVARNTSVCDNAVLFREVRCWCE